MKFPPPASAFALALSFAHAAEAQIYADVQTTLGTFTIDIDYVNTPLAAANFIGLADGSKAWIDSTTGAIRTNTPYYDGIIFHRVIAGFMNQTGSQKGDGSDGPGYSFLDEFATSDFGTPYLAAMANSGPQTNGSQIFVTVGTPTHLNDVHTVFGSVPVNDGPGGIVDGSRDVIDAINGVATGANDKPTTDVVIESVTIRRLGAAANAFDAAAQPLPVAAPLALDLQFPGLATDPTLDLMQLPGSTLFLSLSSNLSAWTMEERYHDAGQAAPLTSFPAGEVQSVQEQHFYRGALVTWPPDAVYPDSLANRTLTVPTFFDEGAPFVFQFDATGKTGTWSWPRAANPGTGSIVNSVYFPDAYGGGAVILISGLNPGYWVIQRAGLDMVTPSEISGRYRGAVARDSFNYSFGNRTSISGTHTLTR